jgi:putative transposase
MANKRLRPEEIITKLRQVEVFMGQGMSRLDAIRQMGLLNKPITAGASSMGEWA